MRGLCLRFDGRIFKKIGRKVINMKANRETSRTGWYFEVYKGQVCGEIYFGGKEVGQKENIIYVVRLRSARLESLGHEEQCRNLEENKKY